MRSHCAISLDPRALFCRCQLIQHGLEIRRQGSVELDFLAGRWQLEPQALGVEKLARYTDHRVAMPAIDFVANQWVFNVGQVDPDLMRTPGKRMASQQRVIAVIANHIVLSNRLAA